MSNRSWVGPAVLLGIGYAIVGIAFAIPATHVQAWRLAAWVASAIGYGAHIAHECLVLAHSPGRAAAHVAAGVALGAFGLAVGANLHALSAGATAHRHLLLLALGIWPIMTAIPAFLVAFIAGLIVTRVRLS